MSTEAFSSLCDTMNRQMDVLSEIQDRLDQQDNKLVNLTRANAHWQGPGGASPPVTEPRDAMGPNKVLQKGKNGGKSHKRGRKHKE